MFRIFLPLYILLFVYGVLYETLVDGFLNTFAEEALVADRTGDFAGGFFMAEALLNQTEPSDWPALLNKMSAPNIPVAVEKLSDYTFTASEKNRLNSGDILVTDLEALILVKRFGDSDLLIRFGPVAIDETLDNTWLITVFSGSFFLVSLIVLWTFTVQRRIRHLSDMARAFGGGDMRVRAKESGSIRIGDLNSSFNNMANQIQHLAESHKDLTNAVSHELRTPISRIRFELEHSQDLETKDEFINSLNSIAEDIGELDDLVNELLTYARFEHSNLFLELEPDDVTGWLKQWQAQFKLTNASITLTMDTTAAPLHARFHEPSLARALSNVVSNATRFARASIIIRTYRDRHWAVITVEDDGPGVPRHHWGTLFDPFVRADKSRSRQTGGVGLGLAIVKQIMRRHGGSVRVDRSSMGGALFELRWPAAVPN